MNNWILKDHSGCILGGKWEAKMGISKAILKSQTNANKKNLRVGILETFPLMTPFC